MLAEDAILWMFLGISVAVLVAYWLFSRTGRNREHFVSGGFGGIDLQKVTTAALDAAPTTSEVKNHYRKLLLYTDDDIRNQGAHCSLRILKEHSSRLFDKADLKSTLTVDDVLANWPAWMAPINTEHKELVPTKEDAIQAHTKILAYLQKNYPQESNVGEETGSILRNLWQDFGTRFVFEDGQTPQLRPDLDPSKLLNNWKNPCS
jgi:hypothetical protein